MRGRAEFDPLSPTERARRGVRQESSARCRSTALSPGRPAAADRSCSSSFRELFYARDRAPGSIVADMAGRGRDDLGVRMPETASARSGARCFNTMVRPCSRPGRASTAPRSRIVAAADQLRRRIQPDLHDGTEQASRLDWPEAARRPRPCSRRLEELRRSWPARRRTWPRPRRFSRSSSRASNRRSSGRTAYDGLGRSRRSRPVRSGRPHGPAPAEQLEIAAFHIVSEALTNAASNPAHPWCTSTSRSRTRSATLEMWDDESEEPIRTGHRLMASGPCRGARRGWRPSSPAEADVAACQNPSNGPASHRDAPSLPPWRARTAGSAATFRQRCGRLARIQAQPLVGKEAVDELHRDRALPDRRGHALDRPCRTSPAASTPGMLVSSENGRRSSGQPSPSGSSRAGEQEPVAVPRDLRGQPVGVRARPDQHEEGVGGDRLFVAGGAVAQDQSLRAGRRLLRRRPRCRAHLHVRRRPISRTR